MPRKPDLLSVAEALARITAAFAPLPAETVGLGEALGRVLAEDVVARVTQPPKDVSAMDGYAMRAPMKNRASARRAACPPRLGPAILPP